MSNRSRKRKTLLLLLASGTIGVLLIDSPGVMCAENSLDRFLGGSTHRRGSPATMEFRG